MPKRLKKTATPATQSELLECISYLHGDVVDGEFEAACCYEYAGESDTLGEAARLWASKMSPSEVALKVEDQFECGLWFIQPPWLFIWQCQSFPATSWNKLGEKERAELLSGFPLLATKVRPLLMNEVWNLDANGIFDEFKAMAAKQMQAKMTPGSKPAEKVYPIIEGWPRWKREDLPWVHALFNVDFRKTPDRLKDEFVAWLKLPQNGARFAKHKCPPPRDDAFKDRLKALAAWRLYEAFEFKWLEAACYADEHRKKFGRAQKIGRFSYKAGEPRPFHNPGVGRGATAPPNSGLLFRDEPAYLKSIRAAKKFRAEMLPCEYGASAAERERPFNGIAEEFDAALKRAKRTSTKSS